MKKRNKRGVSVIIGYVLLVIIGISLSIIVYNWMKKKIPAQPLECPDGVSIMIVSYECDPNNNILNLTLQNNGLFNIDSILIGAAKNKSEIAIYNLTLQQTNKVKSGGGRLIYFMGGLSATNNEKISFSMKYGDKVERIEITPLYLDKEKFKSVVCSNRKIEQEIEGCY